FIYGDISPGACQRISLIGERTSYAGVPCISCNDDVWPTPGISLIRAYVNLEVVIQSAIDDVKVLLIVTDKGSGSETAVGEIMYCPIGATVKCISAGFGVDTVKSA